MVEAEGSIAPAGEVMSPRRRTFAGSLEAWLGALVEIPAALLVVAEIVILFAGVMARYVVHRPLIWSDELASILFLWLSMLGAVGGIPPRRAHAHDSRRRAAPGPRCGLTSTLVATSAALAFLLLIAWPSLEYAYEESFITTPALEIANIWRAAAIPVGIGLMALVALLRLVRTSDRRTVLAAILSVAAVIAVFWLAQPVAAAARQYQPDHLLCRRRRRLRVRRRADRVRLRAGDLRLPGADHAHAADGAGRPDGRGHEPPHPAVGAAVRVPGVADRDDRHGARHGRVPGQPARPRQGRAVLTC